MPPREAEPKPVIEPTGAPADGVCDVCGSDRVTWRKCKLVCLNCGTILKSCADL